MLQRLPELSAAELVQVRARVGFLVGSSAKDTNSNHDWLLEGFTLELRRRGLWSRAQTVPKRLLPTDYAAKAASIREHLLKGRGGLKLRSNESMILGAAAASVLANYLIRAKVPVTPKTLFNNLEKVPVALEAAFPGYWAAGLLGFVLKGHS